MLTREGAGAHSLVRHSDARVRQTCWTWSCASAAPRTRGPSRLGRTCKEKTCARGWSQAFRLLIRRRERAVGGGGFTGEGTLGPWWVGAANVPTCFSLSYSSSQPANVSLLPALPPPPPPSSPPARLSRRPHGRQLCGMVRRHPRRRAHRASLPRQRCVAAMRS